MKRFNPFVRCLVAAGAILTTGTVMAAGSSQDGSKDSWMSLHGTVTSTQSNSFRIDHGGDTMKVVLEDWEQNADALPVWQGDEVTVYGDVTEALFQDSTLEANGIYVADLNTVFYANDHRGDSVFRPYSTAPDIGQVAYKGYVQSVQPGKDRLTIDSGAKELTVYTGDMSHDPLDDEGFQQIEKMDHVMVEGVTDGDFVTKGALTADAIVTLGS